jgi:hypothetical protein
MLLQARGFALRIRRIPGNCGDLGVGRGFGGREDPVEVKYTGTQMVMVSL